ncbi:MAG: hypothetical protein QW620_06630 [Thermoplasmata archaeon]
MTILYIKPTEVIEVQKEAKVLRIMLKYGCEATCSNSSLLRTGM